MKLFTRRSPEALSSQQGFALLEIIVALVIMALVGLMAWRGMDAMIRGREVIDRRAAQDADYAQLVRQFERDCQEVLRRQELGILAASLGVSTAFSGNVSAIAAGAKNIWFIRRIRTDNQDAWMLVGYGIGSNGLQRWTSQPLLQRSDAARLWASVMKDPDLNSTEMVASLELPSVVRQRFQVQTSILSGAGTAGSSAAGTGTTGTFTASPSNTGVNTANNIAASAAPTSPSVTAVLPEQLGITMQWWIKDMNLPITRSCLMGAVL